METLTEIQGKMNADQCCDILAHGLDKSFENLGMVEREGIFKQDNNPKHISNGTKTRKSSFLSSLLNPLT